MGIKGLWRKNKTTGRGSRRLRGSLASAVLILLLLGMLGTLIVAGQVSEEAASSDQRQSTNWGPPPNDVFNSTSSSLVPASSPGVDGFVKDPVTGVVDPPYVVQGITYTQDQVSGNFAGLLYKAEDADNVYLAFEQSVFINDNTYGTNSIGWNPKRLHRLSDLLNSDRMGAKLFDKNGVLVLDFFMDYATQDKTTGFVQSLGATGGDGAINVGSATIIAAAQSSLYWDFNVASPTWLTKPTDSPKRVPTNTYNVGTTADPNFPWVYETTYEFAIRKSAFGTAGFGSVDVYNVHNSPPKTGGVDVTPIPRLVIKKEANPPSGSSVGAGSIITYTITATNVGTVALNNMVITDKVDLNLNTVVPLDGGTFNTSTRTITWNVGTLGIGQTVQVRFTATVKTTALEGAKVFNTGAITASNLPSPATTNTTVHTVLAAPAIGLVKTATPTSIANPKPGDTVTYTYAVTNTGNVTLTNVSVVDDKKGAITLSTTTLAPGASATGSAIHVLTQADIDAGSVSNKATATGTGPDGRTVTATATATVILGRNPAIALVKSLASTVDRDGSADVSLGDTLAYRFVVTNTGNVTLTGVLVTDPLAGLSAIGCPSTTLAPGASMTCSATYTVTAADVAAGQIVNTATAKATPPAGAGPDVSASDSETVAVKKAVLTLAKTSSVTQVTKTLTDNATVSSGNASSVSISKTDAVVTASQITYTITATNTGTGNAVTVVLVDTLPSGVTINANPNSGTVSGTTVTWNLGTLPAGTSKSVSVTVLTD